MLFRNKKEQDENEGKWVGVGGKFEDGETADECLIREVLEETGLTLTSYTFHGIVGFHSDEWGEEDMYLYSADAFEGTLTSNCSEGELKFVPASEVMSLPMWEGDKYFLPLILEGCTSISMDLFYKGDELIVVRNRAVVSGIEMDYAKLGHGEKTMVVLSGLSLVPVAPNGFGLYSVFSPFLSEYTVYLFDRRLNMPEHYSTEMMAEDTYKVLQSLGVKSAYLYGASQGGTIALSLAISHPSFVNKIALASSFAKAHDSFMKVISNWIEIAKVNTPREIMEYYADMLYSEAVLSAYRETIVASGEAATPDDIRRFVICASALCEDYNILDDIAKLQIPIYVSCSEGDKVVPKEASLEIAEKTGATLYMYDSSFGHAVYDESPDFYPRVLEFFNA